MRRFLSTLAVFLTVAALLVSFSGCDKDGGNTGNNGGGDVKITNIVISTDEDGELANNANVEGVIGGELQFYAELETDPIDAGDAEHAVTWSVTGGSGDSYIEDDGLLYIDSEETASPASFNRNSWLTVTATSVIDSKKTASARVKMVAGDPGITNPTSNALTVEVVPAGAATLRLRNGSSVHVSGNSVEQGRNVTISFSQTPAQRNAYTFDSVSASPTIAGFPGSAAGTQANPWSFTMPNAATVITLEFSEVGGGGDTPKLTWTTNNPTALAVAIVNGGTVTNGGEVAAGSNIRVTATLTAGQTATFSGIAGVTGTSPWTFAMPATDASFDVTFAGGTLPTLAALSWTVTPAGAATIAATAGGIPIVTGGQVEVGSSIILTPTAAQGFTFTSITGLPALTGAGPWSFEMPATATALTITYTAGPGGGNPTLTWVVSGGTASATAGGVAITSGSQVEAGATVVLTGTPTPTYTFGTITAPGVTPALTGAGPWTFAMPATATTVTIGYTAPPGTATSNIEIFFGTADAVRDLLSEIAVVSPAVAVGVPGGSPVPQGTTLTITVTLPATGTGSNYFYQASNIGLDGGAAVDFPPTSGGTTGPWVWTYPVSTSDASIWIGFGQPPPPRPDWLEANGKLVYDDGTIIAGSAEYTYWCIGIDPYFQEWNTDYENGNIDVDPGINLGFADPVAANNRLVIRLQPSHLTWSWCSAVWFLEEPNAVAPFVNNIAANQHNLVFEHRGGIVELAVNGTTGELAKGNQPASPNAWTTRTINLGNTQQRVRQIIFTGTGANEPIYLARIRLVPK